MKKLLLMFMISLLLVSIVNGQESDWDGQGTQTLTLWEKFLETISSNFISGATIPTECSSSSHTQKVFDASSTSASIGGSCNDGDYVAVFNCGLSTKYSSLTACNYGGSIREGTKLVTNVILNPDNRYMYFCYSCDGVTPPPEEKIFRGFCLDSQNICRYIDRTYTELQQALGTYNSFECIKPSFPNLYSTSSECESNRETEITCYTECDGDFYETKKVTAKFCSEVGLLSIKPDCISEDETRGCDYGGVLYSPGEEFCFNTNIVKCMGNQVLDTVKICKVDCKGSQCIGEEEPTTTKCSELAGTCGWLLPASGYVNSGYSYDCSLGQSCWIKSSETVPPSVSTTTKCIDDLGGQCGWLLPLHNYVSTGYPYDCELGQTCWVKEGTPNAPTTPQPTTPPSVPTISCIRTGEPFYTNGKLLSNTGAVFGIIGSSGSGGITTANIEDLDVLVPSFSTRYRAEALDSVCCDGTAKYQEGKTVSDTYLIGLGAIWTDYKHLNYEIYTCEPKNGDVDGGKDTDFCFNWINSVGTSLGAKNNPCTVGWWAVVIGFIVLIAIILKLKK